MGRNVIFQTFHSVIDLLLMLKARDAFPKFYIFRRGTCSNKDLLGQVDRILVPRDRRSVQGRIHPNTKASQISRLVVLGGGFAPPAPLPDSPLSDSAADDDVLRTVCFPLPRTAGQAPQGHRRREATIEAVMIKVDYCHGLALRNAVIIKEL